MPAAASSAVPGAATEAVRSSLTTGAASTAPTFTSNLASAGRGIGELGTSAGRSAFMAGLPKYAGTAAVIGGASALTPEPKPLSKPESNLRPYEFAWNQDTGVYEPSPIPGDTSERRYFNPVFTPLPVQRAAQGGQINDPTDEMSQDGGYAKGGLSGILPPRFLSGGGDGMSDSIKANIDGVQEARLADGEFVVPADVVSHLGNGSSKAGAKKLYAMMDKIRKARTGTKRQAPEVNAARYMPA
jgi:hypothetical protein